jgi:hypothetical protein
MLHVPEFVHTDRYVGSIIPGQASWSAASAESTIVKPDLA